MNVVRISGGIGNQLFQYALARKLKDQGKEVFLDVSSYSNQFSVTPRTYSINHFNISIKPLGLYGRVKRKIETDFLKTMEVVRDPDTYCFKEWVLDKDRAFFVGNWVNPMYFSGLEEILRREVALVQPSPIVSHLLEKTGGENSVFVHVRRGDYLKYQDKFIVLPVSYYEQAVSLIKEKIDNPVFYIFTETADDLVYAKKSFSGFLDLSVCWMGDHNLEAHEDLTVMSNCQHGIIANSTFSWWAAYLSGNKNKMIIVPKQFRADGQDVSSLFPKEWGWVKM